MSASLSTAAQALLEAKRNARTLQPFSSQDSAFDLSAGYRIGFELLDTRRAEGEQPIGRKVGLTNTQAWAQLGLEAPIWAHLYDTTVIHTHGEPASLSLAGLVQPRIEPELIFTLSAPVPAGEMAPEKLIEYVESVALGFEIVHCHYPDWAFKPADAVADFGLHAASIIGPPHAIDSSQRAEMARAFAQVSVTLLRDGQVAATGSGADVVSNPLVALGYLARVLATQPQAMALESGELITTGTLTAAQNVIAGQHWQVRVEGIDLPPTEVVFTA